MSALIALFNHKGGVSKTTTTFNLGWALAVQGKRVLIVDADPQCNLTGTALGLNDEDDFEAYYTNNPQSNIVAGLNPVFQVLRLRLVVHGSLALADRGLAKLGRLAVCQVGGIVRNKKRATSIARAGKLMG